MAVENEGQTLTPKDTGKIKPIVKPMTSKETVMVGLSGKGRVGLVSAKTVFRGGTTG